MLNNLAQLEIPTMKENKDNNVSEKLLADLEDQLHAVLAGLNVS